MTTILLALLLAQASPAPSQIPGMAPVPSVPSLLASGVPDVPDEMRARLQQYLNERSAALLDVTPDGGQVLIATRFASTRQLHLVEQPMGARTQLTFDIEPTASARFLPGDPLTIFYAQDKGGGEFFQIYRLDRRTGRSELLTDGKSRHESLLVSRDGRRLAYAGTGRNGKDTDVYVAEIAQPRAARRLTEKDGSWRPEDFSPDGKQLLVVQFRAIDDADLHLVDLESGTSRQLTPRTGKGSVAEARFTPDGKGVYLVTDRYSNFAALYRIDLAKQAAQPRALTPDLGWDVESIAVAQDGSKIALSVDEDGWSRLYVLDPRSEKLRPLDLPRGIVGALRFPDARSDRLALSLQSAQSPADVFQLHLGASPNFVRWTRSEVGGLNPATFVEPALVRYASTDAVQVPAFLFRPRAAPAGKMPVVVIWHGGPEGQSRPTFSPFVQFLAVEMGFAVLLPNVRGSDGYGKAFRAMDDGVKREQALADIGATLEWIAAQPDLDSARAAVYGGSYGGYMVLASVAFYGRRIRAGVDVVGISSLPSFLQNTQAYRRDLRRAEYGDERDPAVRAVQERISPLGSVDKIEATLFVQQGRNDPRVPQSEAEQIVKALRGRGKDVWFLLALNEGHGFQKKENRDYALAATALFLQQKLQGAPRG